MKKFWRVVKWIGIGYLIIAAIFFFFEMYLAGGGLQAIPTALIFGLAWPYVLLITWVMAKAG